MYTFPLELEDRKHKYDKEGSKEENTGTQSLEPKKEILVSKRCRRKLDTAKALILNIRRSRAIVTWRELTIPKHIITLEENYVLRCLESIRNCAVRAAAWNFTSNVDILPYDMSNLAEIKNIRSNNVAGLEIECDDWSVGTVSGSQSMINILNSPLLQNFRKTDLLDTSERQTEVKLLDHNYVAHKRDASISSTNSTSSDRSSSSANSSYFQGMLQFTWKNGLPNHVFTVDDKREVYEANLSKVECLDDKESGYVYTFHARRNSKKECDTHAPNIESIAKMRVSTSISSSCNNNTEVRETQFILSLTSDNHTVDVQSSNHAVRKGKKLARKVVEVFKANKLRSSSKIAASSSAIVEDTPRDPSEDDSYEENKNAPHNPEVAAVIVKEIWTVNPKEGQIGGWGLKFLKKGGSGRSRDTSVATESSRNSGECSTSMDILIPAGIHGGPRSRVAGPSSLIERWISGGKCDCGGWDIGCPLKILNTASSAGFSSIADNSGACKSVDLFLQGSEQNVPVMKMVNIHEGLYYIHILSTLSSLQSFAIAAAIIHSRSPLLRSKVYRS